MSTDQSTRQSAPVVATGSPGFESVNVGDELPGLVLPLTRTLIVSTAIASRDYFDAHHDPDMARERGSKDIFMNILTSNGLVGRFITDWAGPDAFLKRVNIRLGTQNLPGDTMTLTGRVTAKNDADGSVDIEVAGANSMGNHVTGTVRVRLPRATGEKK